jgi:hypothetical protein
VSVQVKAQLTLEVILADDGGECGVHKGGSLLRLILYRKSGARQVFLWKSKILGCSIVYRLSFVGKEQSFLIR